MYDVCGGGRCRRRRDATKNKREVGRHARQNQAAGDDRGGDQNDADRHTNYGPAINSQFLRR